jgi:DNA-binding transcriptional LysR family regulator
MGRSLCRGAVWRRSEPLELHVDRRSVGTCLSIDMQDLNDLYVFSQVVEHNGFTGAAKALGVARSSICRRISQLENRLGIRLVQRTTRHFAVTDIGMEFHQYCVRMVAEAKAAYERVACAKAVPSGMIRVSCAPIIAQLLLGPLIPRFLEKNPQVRIAVEATDRRVDIEENFDLCIRIRQMPSEDSGLIMRSLGIVQQVLVAGKVFLEQHGRPTSPMEAARLATLSYGSVQGPHVWKLVNPQEKEIQVRHEPALIADDMLLVRQAAVNGIGIAQLPLSACLTEIRQGLLEIVLPDFLTPLCEIQVVFPSRRGMLPAVRSFIDFLAAHCVSEVPEQQIKRHTGRGHRENVRFWTSREPLRRLVAGSQQSGEIRVT